MTATQPATVDELSALCAEAQLVHQGNLYAQDIEIESMHLFKRSKRLADLRKEAGEIVDQIAVDVATDKAYPNEMARKAEIKARLSLHAGHCQLEDDIRNAEYDVAYASAKLERLRNEFSLHKLERRERIAAVEALN